MLLSFEELATIAARASTPPERLGPSFSFEAADPRVVERRLQRLIKLRAGGDRQAFRSVLDETGESEDRLSASLGNARWNDASRLPEWAEWFRLLISSVPHVSADARFIQQEAPLPFEEILSPLVLSSRELLKAKCGTVYGWPAARVHIALERTLLEWLTKLCESALLTEFSLYRLRFPRHDSGQSAAYHQFVSDFAASYGRTFLTEYAVLTRLIAIATRNWVEFASEFLTRAAADVPAISEFFLAGCDPGQLIEVETGLSDPHRGSRSAVAVRFSSGLRLIYKPRNLRSMEVFFDLIQWLNGIGLQPPLAAARALDRGAHGWAEFIQHQPCSTHLEALNFFERSGMLLRLLDLLETTDVHRENIISRGTDPILVDTETLLSPRVFSAAEEAVSGWAETQVARKFRDSVLRTALLPQWSIEGGIVSDSSALGGFEPETALLAVRRSTNTDDMATAYSVAALPLSENVPFSSGTPAALSLEHAQAVERGFATMDRFLVEHRSELQGDGNPFARLAELRPRFVFRGTSIYFKVLRQSMSAGVLRDGADRWIELHALAKPLHVSTEALRYAPIVRAEQEALWSLDIPLFLVTPEGEIENLDTTSPALFEATGYARVRANIDRLGRESLSEPLQHIRQSFCARLAVPPLDRCDAGISRCELPPREQMLELAASLGADLMWHAVRGEDGSLTWASLNYLSIANRYRYFPAGLGLADGAAGIALFLAGLWRVTGDRDWHKAAFGALCPIRRVLRHAGTDIQNLAWAQAFRRILGAGSGLGGIVYSLAHLSQLLEDGALLDDARLAASMIAPELIRADRAFSLQDGAAGAAIGLLALHRIAGGADLVDPIVLCGRHLLEHRSPDGVWMSQHGQPARGYAMGSAGIASALIRISRLAGDTSYADAAVGALKYEASNREGLTWAHGAAGLGIALSDLPDEFRALIDQLSGEVAKAPLPVIDSPWFGTFGEAEFVNARGAEAVARADERGSFQLFADGLDPAWSAGMYHGVSGIGYALLRLAEPRALPAVLSFE